MSFEKKTVYHSELVGEGQIEVLITSDVLKSKFKKQGKDSFYIAFKYEGKEHQYTIENAAIQRKLAGLKGHVVSLTASGSREEADIDIFDAAGPGTPQSNQRRAEQPPVPNNAPAIKDPAKAAKVMLLQHVNARVLSFEAADETARRWMDRGHEDLTEEQWASAANCYYISLDRAGLIAVLPWQEIPPHVPKEKRQPEPPPRQPEPPPRQPDPDDDEIPF